MTKRERVVKAINFDSPDSIPVWNFNRDQTDGDILRYEMAIEESSISEWGYKWLKLEDGTMGQPSESVIESLDDISSYKYPILDGTKRMKSYNSFIAQSKDHYTLAGMGITGFNTYTFLRGFENSMVDFLLEKEKACELLDKIFSFETELIEIASKYNFKGIHFQDDWGTQDRLIISPQLWREIFKPRYKKQFEYAHSKGLHVWFHCCGNIISIIPDFHEIGVDVMNISQPNVVDIETVGKMLAGKQCFMSPISYQTVSINGSPDEIFSEAERLFAALGTNHGGFIGYVEEYSSMGMSERNYRACVESFIRLNNRIG